jgi:hypothetical protein
MATYKVIQDIEAEDKILGPLTLKQFIFAIIFIGIGFIEFQLATTTALSVVRWPFVIMLLIPMFIFGFLAAPISRDQPNDIWLLARLRFLIKPHKRIWNQDGVSQLVTITAPKRVEQILTNGLSQHEVKSRLQALASTLDSRGWAIKNVDVNMFAQPGYLATDDGSDRLVAPSNLPVIEAVVDVQAADDILDPTSNPTAQHLDQMVQASTAAHRQQVRDSVQHQAPPSAAATPDYWFLNQPAARTAEPTPDGYATFQRSKVVAPGSEDENVPEPTEAEKAFIAHIEAEKEKEPKYRSHIKTVQPLGVATQAASAPAAASAAVQDDNAILPPVALPAPAQDATIPQSATSTPTSNPAILSLANNDDLNVATIARQAQRISESDDEVVISLH